MMVGVVLLLVKLPTFRSNTPPFNMSANKDYSNHFELLPF